MITLENLEKWLNAPAETERLEFKTAKNHYEKDKLLKYCVALANEGGGYFVLGVTDKPPRRVVGSQAFPSQTSLNEVKSLIFQKLRFRVEVTELQHPDGRVLVLEVPSRPLGQPLEFDGTYLMRVGEELVSMTPDVLKRIFAEDKPDWFFQTAKSDTSPDEVIALLDTQSYFELLGIPYPINREAVLERLQNQKLIESAASGWKITNLAAILLAKKLDAFSSSLARKAPRFIIYEGTGKLHTREDKTDNRGYAVGFEALLDLVHSTAPQNRFIEEVLRKEVKMFPKEALRELIANALIHQDFLVAGASVMIEMYIDRIEISNPGLPSIEVDRFIDDYRSRNETLADMMRRFNICEEKGSGIDKVITAVEAFQLPAPDFRISPTRTTAILFAHQNFADMRKSDRIRACYQHCCLFHVSNKRMSNQTLRDRFRLSESSAATVSLIIKATKEAGLIKMDESESTSTRYASYLPFWT
jgi:ATP-dependent DNA helicase RecG